jgi:cytochrome c-type biogenesis protein CcmE
VTPRRQRMLLIGLVLAGVAVAATFAIRAFQENLTYFIAPTQVAEGHAPPREFRLGGLVLDDSVKREPGSLTVRFVVSDLANSVPVQYTGVLPDLFKEGKGVVVRGRMGPGGEFRAEEVIAKHDENYEPPEVTDALAKGKKRAAADK